MYKAIFSEIIGTFFLISTILVLKKPIFIISVLLMAIYLFRNVSGAHFNPAVSFVMFMNNTIQIKTLIIYVLAQLTGAMLALHTWKK